MDGAQDKIVMQGMEFYGYHGALPGEQEIGQRFRIDLELAVSLERSGHLDDVAETVDYSKVYGMVAQIMKQERYNLIEALAERIARAVLDRFPAEEVMVRVKKPQAPLEGSFEYVGVEIRRKPFQKPEAGKTGAG